MLTRLQILILLAGACTATFADTFVVPTTLGTAPGNQPIAVGSAPFRTQEIISNGVFPPLVITGLRVRAAAGKGPVTVNYPSYKVTLSTTQAYPTTNSGHALPSATFADNVGPDATTVYNSALVGSSPGCSGPAACPFDLVVVFTTPFSYDPSKGRLLVDIVSASGGTSTGSVDGVSFANNATGSLSIVSGDPSQAAGMLSPAGLVLGFDLQDGPTITSVSNAASNIPNPIAQGAIFIIKGSGLGPATLSISPAPFQTTTLSGTSIAITSGATVVNALMYYTSGGQVAALLPSSTPAGAVSFTVTYNGKTSPVFGKSVTPNNLGIFTIDSTGQGPGIVTYPDYSLVSTVKAANCGGPNTTCGAANPGDTLILWATGLGPVTGSDAAGAGLGQNMPAVPLKIWLGGIDVPVIYQGRSGCCVGEDQIVFKVPETVPTGCAVPLLIQINNLVSNNVLMPIAAKGSRECPAGSQLSSVMGVPLLAAGSPVSFMDIELKRRFNDAGTFQDNASFETFKILSYNPGIAPFFPSYVEDIPLGTCLVFNSAETNRGFPISAGAGLNAGSNFTIQGPSGSMSVKGDPSGSFNTLLSANGTFLNTGDYTVTGTGGPDVGAFMAAATMPAPITLTGPSLSNLTVARANGLTFTWTGGGTPQTANARVEIVLTSSNNAQGSFSGTVDCFAAATAGTLTIPPHALLALPSSSFSHLNVILGRNDATFTAAGVNLGVINTSRDIAATGGFPVN